VVLDGERGLPGTTRTVHDPGMNGIWRPTGGKPLHHEEAMPAELKLEIIAYAPTAFFFCRNCEAALGEGGVGRSVRQEQLRAGLPPDLAREYGRLSDWVRELAARHEGRIAVHVIDVASVRGFWKSLRHGIRRYPAIIVGGQVFAGTELSAAAAAVDRSLPAASRA
jgi:hypothetical protein